MANRDKRLLYPVFADQLNELERRLTETRLPFYIFMGIRSWAEQNALYAQGRTKPGSIVTNARGGDSWHNYGLGADYVLDGQLGKPGIQWSWQTKSDLNSDGRNDWLQLAEIARACGLESGYYWKKFPDLPHVQNRFGLTIVEAKEIYKLGGLQAVWESCKAA